MTARPLRCPGCGGDAFRATGTEALRCARCGRETTIGTEETVTYTHEGGEEMEGRGMDARVLAWLGLTGLAALAAVVAGCRLLEILCREAPAPECAIVPVAMLVLAGVGLAGERLHDLIIGKQEGRDDHDAIGSA